MEIHKLRIAFLESIVISDLRRIKGLTKTIYQQVLELAAEIQEKLTIISNCKTEKPCSELACGSLQWSVTVSAIEGNSPDFFSRLASRLLDRSPLTGKP